MRIANPSCKSAENAIWRKKYEFDINRATKVGPQGEFIIESYCLKGSFVSEGSGESNVTYTNTEHN